MSSSDGSADLPKRAWWRTLRRAVAEFREDDLTDRAAALTYYSVLSLFPALIALVAIVGLVGDPMATTRALTDILAGLGPSTATRTFAGPIQGLTSHRGTAGVLLVAGTLAALWTASGYVAGLTRAANAIYGVEEGRPFWKLRPLQLVITLGVVVLLALVSVALVLSGPVARAVGDAVGLGDNAVRVWEIGKWPVLVAIVLTIFAVLYYALPNVRIRFRWITPGSVAALMLWLAASAVFAFYVANFGSYNKTYGTLGGVVTFLVWLWIGNLAVLFGLELNAELERRREQGADREQAFEPRVAAERKQLVDTG
jgi:membrane protein